MGNQESAYHTVNCLEQKKRKKQNAFAI